MDKFRESQKPPPIFRFVFVLFILLALFYAPFSQAELDCNKITDISYSECRALGDLELAYGQELWSSDRTTVCDTSQVFCEADQVVGVQFSGGFHSAQLYETISNLTHLRALRITSSGLTQIPENIGNLVDLTTLDLSNNQLSGSIPDSIGSLVNLRVLELDHNQLSDPIPESIGNLSDLETLYLNNNKLTGQIPSSIGNLTNLIYLFIYQNRLSGPIPSSIGNLDALDFLWLTDNQLTGSLPASLSNLNSLAVLDLSYNQLSGSIPPEFGNMTRLEALLLNNNQLTGLIPDAVKKLSPKVEVDFSHNLLDKSNFLVTKENPQFGIWGNEVIIDPFPEIGSSKPFRIGLNLVAQFCASSFGIEEVDIDYKNRKIMITLLSHPWGIDFPTCPQATGLELDIGVLPDAEEYFVEIYQLRNDLYLDFASVAYEPGLIGYFSVNDLITNDPDPGTISDTPAMQETPSMGSKESGIGIIRGWACDAYKVEIAIDGGSRIPVAYGTSREDTRSVCGDADNGYGMVFAWGLLGKGIHRLQTFVDNVEIEDIDFEVVGLDQAFAKDLPTRSYRLFDFPNAGESVNIGWSEAHQGFRIHYHSP